MTMEIRDGRFISRCFYAELGILGLQGNMAGWIYRDEAEEPYTWRLTYRMRYYRDHLTTRQSKDRMTWFEAHADPGTGLGVLLPSTRVIFETAGGGKYEEVIIESAEVAVIMKRVSEQPWASTESMTEEAFNATRRSS